MMKLVLCIGAAAVVSALDGSDQKTSSVYTTGPFKVCEADRMWASRGQCINADPTVPNPTCVLENAEELGYHAQGHCCDGNDFLTGDDTFCAAIQADDCVYDGSCGHCYYEKKAPEPAPCCKKGESLDELFVNKTNFESWTTLSNDAGDVYVADNAQYCGESQVKIKLDDEVMTYTCYKLCCDCCHNMHVTLVNAPRDFELVHDQFMDKYNVSTSAATVKSYAAYEQIHTSNGPASICQYDDSPLILMSADGAILATDVTSEAYHRVGVSCQKKTDGFCCSGPAGPAIMGNYTTY